MSPIVLVMVICLQRVMEQILLITILPIVYTTIICVARNIFSAEICKHEFVDRDNEYIAVYQTPWFV